MTRTHVYITVDGVRSNAIVTTSGTRDGKLWLAVTNTESMITHVEMTRQEGLRVISALADALMEVK